MIIYEITFAFVALDFVTGIVKALKEKEFTSTVMREGLFHKVGSFLILGFGALVEYAQNYIDLGVSIPFATAICSYIILMEIGSIIENIGKINPNIIPSVIRKHFTKLQAEDKGVNE